MCIRDRGVAWALAKNGCGFDAGFDLALTSDLPAGAGLSSSAAVELATAVALGGVFGFDPGPGLLARWCRQAENDFVGVPCGILDQGCSAFGKAGRLVLIDCREEKFSTEPLPESVRFWVFNTGKKHALLDSLYATRRGECCLLYTSTSGSNWVVAGIVQAGQRHAAKVVYSVR